jgi:hypothetical protein
MALVSSMLRPPWIFLVALMRKSSGKSGPGGPGAVDDFQGEAHAAGEVAAEDVQTLVGRGRHELGDEIAMGAVDFDRVEAGFPGPDRGVPERVDQGEGLVGGELPGEFAHDRAGDRGGRDRLVADDGPAGLAAGVVELHGDLAAVAVHGVGQAAHPWDQVIAPQAELVGDGLAQGVDGRDLDDDKPKAALGPGRVIVHELVGDCSVRIAEVRTHGRYDKSIFNL